MSPTLAAGGAGRGLARVRAAYVGRGDVQHNVVRRWTEVIDQAFDRLMPEDRSTIERLRALAREAVAASERMGDDPGAQQLLLEIAIRYVLVVIRADQQLVELEAAVLPSGIW
jgi:hypothetical protein